MPYENIKYKRHDQNRRDKINKKKIKCEHTHDVIYWEDHIAYFLQNIRYKISVPNNHYKSK